MKIPATAVSNSFDLHCGRDSGPIALGVLLRRDSTTGDYAAEKENLNPNFHNRETSVDILEKSCVHMAAGGLFHRRSCSSSSSSSKCKVSSYSSTLQKHKKCNLMKHAPIDSSSWVSVDSVDKHLPNIWDHSDSDSAPAPSWFTLPNRSLLHRPLPLDIGRCSCVIVKEEASGGFRGALYSFYTNEGVGRDDRKLAVAYQRRRNGKSEFVVAQNTRGITSFSDDSFLGIVNSNFFGSKYKIWNQSDVRGSHSAAGNRTKMLMASVRFRPTIATWTGSYRRMRAWVPKHQSLQLLNNSTQIQSGGLWEGQKWEGEKVHQLSSRAPCYNSSAKRYELDFRDGAKPDHRIRRSAKNFQLTLEGNGRQTVLQLGRVGNSKYVLDYRHPLSGYQAFCICLASIDRKLCCTF